MKTLVSDFEEAFRQFISPFPRADQIMDMYTCIENGLHWPLINFSSVLPAQEPWEYHYPTAFGNQYVEHTLLIQLRGGILGAKRRINNKGLLWVKAQCTPTPDPHLFSQRLPESDGSECQDAVMEVHVPFSTVAMKQLKG